MIQTTKQTAARTTTDFSPYFVRAYALALFLCASGLEVLSSEMARDGSAVLFVFNRHEAEPLLPRFHATKDLLNNLSTSARTR